MNNNNTLPDTKLHEFRELDLAYINAKRDLGCQDPGVYYIMTIVEKRERDLER